MHNHATQFNGKPLLQTIWLTSLCAVGFKLEIAMLLQWRRATSVHEMFNECTYICIGRVFVAVFAWLILISIS